VKQSPVTLQYCLLLTKALNSFWHLTSYHQIQLFEVETSLLYKKIIEFVCLLIGVLCIPLNALATHHIHESYYLDPSDSLTIEQVAAQPFRDYKNNLHLGFTDGAVWIKVEITHPENLSQPAKVNEDYVLILSPFVLENITVYEQTSQNWISQSGGSLSTSAATICPYGMHCFTLNSDANAQQKVIFVKVKHTGYLALKSEVTSITALATITAVYTESITFAQSIALSLFLISLVLIMIDRSMFILVYSFMQLSIFLYIVFASGKMYTFLPFLHAENFSYLNYQFINFRIFLVILLGYTFTKNYGVNPGYRNMVYALMGISACACILIAQGYLLLGIYAYVLIIALNIPVQIYGLHKAINVPLNIKRLLLVAYLVFAALVMYGYINVFTGAEILSNRGAEFIFFTNYRLNGIAFGMVVFLVLIFKYYDEKINSILREKDLQFNVETSRINHEKLNERQTLIDILTHELKNPLTTLRFATYSLNQKITADAETQSRAHRINATLDRMDQLITQVANSNKIDRFQIEQSATEVNAKSLIHQIIEDLLPSNVSTESRFVLELPEEIYFYGNLQILFLIIENLISNALKYAEPDSLIHAQVTKDHHASVFRISNRFPVNAKPDPEKLFQRYYRHDTFQPLAGMGIGLSLIKDAVEKIGSNISFELDDIQITFTLKVPLCQP
jgi:signal transduction histidine kinase